MGRYILSFTKQGFSRYTSHLDLLRLFKRAFKRCGIPLAYSQGFNPHPKMSFSQPLSLGYLAKDEILEFQLDGEMATEEILRRMRSAMPLGITISYCKELDIKPKTLASIVEGAKYLVFYPSSWKEMIDNSAASPEDAISGYLAQTEIITKKRQKKTKAMVDVDIRNMISSIKVWSNDITDITGLLDRPFVLEMNLNAGSDSNLSPELVINTFNEFAGLNVKREDIEVEREFLYFKPCIPHTLGLHLDYGERIKDQMDE